MSGQQQQLQKEICDTVGVQIHRQLKAVLNEISEFKPSPLQLIFTSQYLKSILFNVAYQHNLHSDWCFDKHWLKYLCDGVIPTRLWDFFQRGDGLRSLASSDDLDVQKTIELAEESANYDVDHVLEKSTNLYRYLTGQQPLTDHHDWPPSTDNNSAKTDDVVAELQTDCTFNHHASDLGIDVSAYPKAGLAIKYRPDIQRVITELQAYFPEYSRLVVDTLETQPQIDTDSLKQLVYQEHDADYSVYENPIFNDALIEAAKLGQDAKKEMKEVLDILGDTADISSIMESLSSKYSQSKLRANQHESKATNNTDISSNGSSAESLSASRSESLIDTELPESLRNLSANDTQTDNSEEAIHNRTNPSGSSEYEFDGKHYYSQQAAERARQLKYGTSNDENFQLPPSSSLRDSNSEKSHLAANEVSDEEFEMKAAIDKIKTAITAGNIQMIIAILICLGLTGIAVSESYSLFTSGGWATLLPFYIWAVLVSVLVYWLKRRSHVAAISLFLLVIAPPILGGIFIGPFEVVRGGIWTVLFGWAYFRGVQGTLRYRVLTNDKLTRG